MSATQTILDYIETLTIVDTHEHLSAEKDRLKQQVDFSTLFSHYCTSDFIASGMNKTDHERLNKPETPLDEKWAIFAPHYELIKNGSYARAARMSMEKFYGYDDLHSLTDAEAVTERIRAANVEGLYDKVLKETCKLRTSFNFGGFDQSDGHLTPVEFVTGLAVVWSMEQLRGAATAMECDVPTTLSRYVDALGAFLTRRKEAGLAGVKFHTAYERDLEFNAATTHEAEVIFDRVYEESQGWRNVVLGYDETRPLQNYLTHRIVEIAGDVGLPVVFHTGMQAGNENRPDNCRPERLWNLIYRYPKTTFILLHSGFPWCEEAGMLAKYFANAYLDMAWDHIMSPEISYRALKVWIDMVPRNKVFGFGGDYCVVEKVYGHLTLAKRDIARALGEKIDEGAMTETDAQRWAKFLLHDNPAQVYGLDELEAKRR